MKTLRQLTLFWALLALADLTAGARPEPRAPCGYSSF